MNSMGMKDSFILPHCHGCHSHQHCVGAQTLWPEVLIKRRNDHQNPPRKHMREFLIYIDLGVYREESTYCSRFLHHTTSFSTIVRVCLLEWLRNLGKVQIAPCQNLNQTHAQIQQLQLQEHRDLAKHGLLYCIPMCEELSILFFWLRCTHRCRNLS